MIRVTVRLVIGLLCAGLVLIVGVSTLAITYTVSLSSLRSLGKTHAAALANTAQLETEMYFNAPAQDVEAVGAAYRQKGAGLPSNLPDPASPAIAEHAFGVIFNLALSANNFSYSNIGVILDDGSAGGVIPIGRAAPIPYRYFFWRSIGNKSFENNTGQMHAVHRAFRVSDFFEYDNADDFTTLVRDMDLRVGVYDDLKAITQGSAMGAWFPEGMFRRGGETVFVLTCGIRILDRNSTYIGAATAAVELDAISEFLLHLKTSPGTEAFVVRSTGFILGSTHSEPYQTFEPTSRNTSVGLGFGCLLIQADFDDPATVESPQVIGCRTQASRFPYAPLQKAAEAEDNFADVTAPSVRIMDTADGSFFVAVAPVPNRFRLFGLTVVLCIPEEAILGDIVAGRNLAIGVTCGVLVAAVGVSFGLVYLLLQPLADVSKDMMKTAHLRETEDPQTYSRLAEIRDLQKAYAQMNTAIRSFTRYVPRDVVKDLMASGELCTIRMRAQQCTMLFCDIAGFTTVCERVPPDTLSTLVTGFFERASRIIMEHDGQIDKFIGDCIMAVWGAPFGAANQEVKAALAGKLVDRETMVAPLAYEWDAAGELLRVRVGIASGEVLAGNMGSAERMNYTVIGDAVNLASRLEGLNKQFDTRVMVDTATADRLAEVFVLRLLGAIGVVGRESAEEVYEVVGLHPALSDAAAEVLGAHDDECNRLHMSILHDSATVISTRSRYQAPASADGASWHGSGSHDNVRRVARVPTATLVRRAIIGSTASGAAAALPLTCNAAEMAAAREFSQVVRLFLSRNFSAAADSFGQLASSVRAQEDTKAPLVASFNDAAGVVAGGDDKPASVVEEPRRLVTSLSTRPLSILQSQLDEVSGEAGHPQDASVIYRASVK